MNIVQLENYRQKLLQLKLVLLTDNEVDSSRLVEIQPAQLDALSFHLQIKKQEAIKHKQAQLQAIDGALRRIDNDDFGFCYVCDQAISEAQLNFDLTVTRCIKCADKAFD
ncbi:TraR/DksA family transcriptional regulator [Methylophaga sp.]|uniref:TraR/DksA family transcriptional regulator n=1 Tax=Methylophaga sp. TaxID=2024840 RepID=UPI0027274DA8|nr:TraR/DksA family transcriptional regulator [Methylophaga sp.]MDO8827102.1 TraR/DksA family transcriptional regulator [Methylophaga sp.]